MTKSERSHQLLGRTMQVLMANKRLLLFPLLSTFLCFVMLGFFLIPGALSDTSQPFFSAAHWQSVGHALGSRNPQTHRFLPTEYGSILMAGFYLVSMFLATFFNVALFNEILNALDGRPVSLSGGLRFACSRWKAIAVWSLFAGIVGVIIQKIEQRLGFVGRWIGSLLGIGWSVASVFVIPIIVREEHSLNPLGYLKTSGRLLRKTWGESLIGYLGIRLGGTLILMAIIMLAGFGVGAVLHNPGLAMAFSIPLILLLSIFINLAGNIFKAALYIYATEGVMPGPFEPDDMELAWKVKSGRKPLAQ